MHLQPRVHLHMRQANEKPRYSGKKVDMLIVIIQLTNIKAQNFNYSTCQISIPHRRSLHGQEYQLDSGNMVHSQIYNAFQLPVIQKIKKDQTYSSQRRLSLRVGLMPIKKIFSTEKNLVIMIDAVRRTKHNRLKSSGLVNSSGYMNTYSFFIGYMK